MGRRERDYTISNFIVVLVTRALTLDGQGGGRVAGYIYTALPSCHVRTGARVRNTRVSDPVAGIWPDLVGV